MSRIRQIKPSWFLDKVLRRGTTADAREFYIGLWMLADDAGWLEWDVERIAAELYPYDPVAKREQAIERWAATLETLVPADPHLVVMTCGHARVPHMPKHQRIAGNQSFTVANIHVGSQGLRPPELCVAASSRVSLQVTDQAPSSDESLQVATGSPGIGRVGNGTERNGTVPLEQLL